MFDDKLDVGSKRHFSNGNVIVRVNLHVGLEEMLKSVDKNESINISFRYLGNGVYKIDSMSANDSDLDPNYQYWDFEDHEPFRIFQPPPVQ